MTSPTTVVTPEPAMTTGDKLFLAVRSFVLGLLIGCAVGAVTGAGLYALIEPDCSVSQEWLCGLGEVLMAGAVGLAVAVGVFVYSVFRLIAAVVPKGERALLVLSTTVGGMVLLWTGFAVVGLIS